MPVISANALASVLLCGSLGSTLALWREKTYQSLATTMLVLVLWLAVDGLPTPLERFLAVREWMDKRGR